MNKLKWKLVFMKFMNEINNRAGAERAAYNKIKK